MRRGEVASKLNPGFHVPQAKAIVVALRRSPFRLEPLRRVLADPGGIRYAIGSPPPYVERSADSTPFVRATDIKDGEIVLTTLRHVARQQPEQMAKCLLTSGELILVRSGVNAGDCAVVPQTLIGAYAAYDLILRPSADVLSEFLAPYLHAGQGREQLNLVRIRSAQPHLNAEEVASVLVPVPPLPVQRRMVSELEAARKSRQAKLADADALLSGVDGCLLSALRIARVPDDNRRTFAAPQALVRARFDPHFHAPRFMHVAQILSTVPTQRLGSLVAFSNETWKPEEHPSPTFRYIEISNVSPRTGDAKWEEVRTSEAPSRARKAVRAGDIIVSLTRPHHGSIAHLSEEFNGCVASTGFAVIREVDCAVRSDYLWCILRTHVCLQQMLQRSSGGNYPAVTEAELANIMLPVPCACAQQAIAAEARRRHDEARRLRAAAEASWKEANNWLEKQLLGPTGEA